MSNEVQHGLKKLNQDVKQLVQVCNRATSDIIRASLDLV